MESRFLLSLKKPRAREAELKSIKTPRPHHGRGVKTDCPLDILLTFVTFYSLVLFRDLL